MKKLQLLTEMLDTVYSTSDNKLAMLILASQLPEDLNEDLAVHLTPNSFMYMAKLMSNYLPSKVGDEAFNEILLDLYEEGMISFNEDLKQKLIKKSEKLDDYIYIQ